MPGYRVNVKETRTVVRVRRIQYQIVDAKDERAARDLIARAYELLPRTALLRVLSDEERDTGPEVEIMEVTDLATLAQGGTDGEGDKAT